MSDNNVIYTKELKLEFSTGYAWPKHLVIITCTKDGELFLNGQPAQVMCNGLQLRFKPIDKEFKSPVKAKHAIITMSESPGGDLTPIFEEIKSHIHELYIGNFEEE